jgi:hypothetical protein
MLYQLSYTPAGRVPLSGAMDLGKRIADRLGVIVAGWGGGAGHAPS